MTTPKTGANRAYPSIPRITGETNSHTQALLAIKEAIEIHERRTGEKLDSFVRLRELVDLQLVKVHGNQIALGDAAGGGGGTDTDDQTAAEVPYDNGASGLTADDVQEAIDELAAASGGIAAHTVVTRGATWIRSGSAIETPVVDIPLYCPRDATILGVTILTHDYYAGDCVIDIWKDDFASYPPTVGDSICPGSKPTIVGDNTYRDTTLSGWDTDIVAGDVIMFHLESCSDFTFIHVSLDIQEDP